MYKNNLKKTSNILFILDLTVNWVIDLLLQKESNVNTPLQKAHVILFDSHKKILPLKFLQHNTTQLTLLETTQHDASVQRVIFFS